MILSLLGLPPEWGEQAFLRFFEVVLLDSPSHEAFDLLADMFRAVERSYGEVPVSEMQRMGVASGIGARRVLRALRDTASTPRRQLEVADRKAALRLMRLRTIASLVLLSPCSGRATLMTRRFICIIRPCAVFTW